MSSDPAATERLCIMCLEPIPPVVLDIDEEAECCSVDCMEKYANQLRMNWINWDGESE